MMDLMLDEFDGMDSCSQDDEFVTPPLMVKQSPLPYVQDSWFKGISQTQSTSMMVTHRGNNRQTVQPRENALEQKFPFVDAERNNKPFPSVYSKSKRAAETVPQTFYIDVELEEKSDGSHGEAVQSMSVSEANSCRVRSLSDNEVFKPKPFFQTSCRSALNLQTWCSDSVFAVDNQNTEAMRQAVRSRLKRPSTDMFHPRQLKSSRYCV